jgi:type IX secretion system PorP/SprF family membrane protein
MKKYIIIIAILLTTQITNAQQLQTSSFYDLQGIIHNAGMAGVNSANFVGVSYKTQWNGIAGKPTTGTLFGSFKLPKQKLGVSANIYNDVTGPTSRTGVQLSIAKHIALQNGGLFAVGIENRFQQYAINQSKLPSLVGDPALAGKLNSFKYDAGFGVSYSDQKFQIGAGVSQLVQTKLNTYSGNLNPNQEGRLYRHFYVHSLYNYNIDENTVITPNVLFTYLPNAPLEMQGNIRIEHNKLFWYGVGGKLHQGFMLSGGLRINKSLLVGYAYDIYKTPISIFDNGSNGHEFIMRYEFAK